MNKVVGAAEFKAKCLAILDEVQATGESVTITKRGRPVATIGPAQPESETRKLLFGMLREEKYRFDWKPEEPAADPADWDALR